MILKIINQAEEILFHHNERNLSTEDTEKLKSFNDRNLESVLVIVNEGVKVGQAHSVEELADKNGVKEVIMKLKD